MIKLFALTTTITACLLLLAGCAGPSASYGAYTAGTAQQSSSSQLLDVGRVLIEADRAYYGNAPSAAPIVTCHTFGNRTTCY